MFVRWPQPVTPQGVEASQLAPFSSLEVLDLTRNNIATLAAGTFEALVSLKELRLGVNMIRQVRVGIGASCYGPCQG